MTFDQAESLFVRLTRWGIIFYIGWIASAAHFGLYDLHKDQAKLVEVQQVVLPKALTALKQANCDKGKLTDAAVQAIVSTQSNGVPTPTFKDVAPCAPVAPVKPQEAAKLISAAPAK